MGATLVSFFLFNYQQATVSVQDTIALQEKIVVADPVHLSIPSVGIEADFEGPLGLNEDKTVAVPDSYETVGWYQYGPKPGELGPSVVLGHFDSYKAPAVFYDLVYTKPGEIITITREDGTKADFIIERLVHRSQTDFPTEEVYGNLEYPGLRLITCSGFYDHGKQVYSHNLIVYARLIES